MSTEMIQSQLLIEMVFFIVQRTPLNLWDSETWFLRFPSCAMCLCAPVLQVDSSIWLLIRLPQEALRVRMPMTGLHRL